jgi:hypothetical protein
VGVIQHRIDQRVHDCGYGRHGPAVDRL